MDITRETVDAADRENNRLIEELGKQGVGLDVTSILQNRLNIFIEYFVGDFSSMERLEFETKWNTFMAEMLQNVQSQVSRTKLLQGVNVAPPDNLRQILGNGHGKR